MSSILFRALRLPVDLVLITADLLRLTRWRAVRWVARTFGILGPHTGPLCGQRWRTQDAEGNVCSLCGHGRLYGNAFMFELLCPWAIRVRGGLCFCRRRSSYKLPVFRYSVVGVMVMLAWLGLGYGLFRLAV